MANLHLQDKASERKGSTTTQKELDDYRKWALDVVNDNANRICQWGERVKHPWSDDRDTKSQVHVYQCEGDVPVRHFDDANDMIEHWESTPKDGTEAMTNRRIFYLEGTEPRTAERLGVKLEIPPHFFLAHCDHFADLRVIDDAFASQNNSTYWKVPVKQHRSVIGVPPGDYYVEAGNCYRRDITIQKGMEWITFETFVSYWGKRYGRNSWTVVILIDPQQICLRSKNAPSGPHHVLGPHSYGRDILVEVMAVSASRGQKTTQPVQRDMFKAATQAFSSKKLLHTQDPFTSTMFIRNLVRSAWEESITRSVSGFQDILRYDNQHYAARLNHAAHPDAPDDKMDSNGTYFNLMAHRQGIQEEKGFIASIMRSFRCWNADDIPREYQQLDEASREVSQEGSHMASPSAASQEIGDKTSQEANQEKHTSPLRDQYSEAVPSNKDRLQELFREEKRAWRMIYETVCKMEADVADHMEMWSQRAALEQAATSLKLATEANKQTVEAKAQTAEANRMARTSGQLTKIATIIVPCTFVGSIFSMGGRFAAGEDLFFVYWVISVPATIMLLAWVLHHDLLEFYQVVQQRYNALHNSRLARKGTKIEQKLAEQPELFEKVDAEDGTTLWRVRHDGGQNV